MANINYIGWNDYSISINNENLDEIVNQAVEMTDLTKDELMGNSELTAQAEIRSYLKPVGDIDAEFDKNYTDSPDVRLKLVIRCVVNLSLYNLHMTISPRDVPEKVEKAYEHCLEMLEAARKGELDFGLGDPPTDDTDAVAWRTIGSNYKFTSKEFREARILDTDTDV